VVHVPLGPGRPPYSWSGILGTVQRNAKADRRRVLLRHDRTTSPVRERLLRRMPKQQRKIAR
jgi:hypothetical protein